MNFVQRDKKVRVRNLQRIFYTPSRAEELMEAVARTATLKLAKELRSLDEEDRSVGMISSGENIRRVSTLLKEAKSLMAMAEVSYSDTAVKKRAESDAEVILQFIMAGKLQVEADENDKIVTMLVQSIQSETGEFKSCDLSDSLVAAALEFESDCPGEDNLLSPVNDVSASERCGSINRVIGDFTEALRYLQEGVEFTKTTFVATYRYGLKLILKHHKLVWSRLDGGGKMHSFPVDCHVIVRGEGRKVTLINGAETCSFVFPATSSALQFKGCLEV
jgi:hypothetical protein